ncbi:MAG: type VI secretion system lipoprotein TssJ [Betaproteobacteria bacterium]|nr:type VI secretion system lipoprotein TssJ [Betaproteobacteria bacterium]
MSTPRITERRRIAAILNSPGELRSRRLWLCSGVGVAASAVLSGCASGRAANADGDAPAWMLDLQFVASADLNPNERGQAAPVLVRLYELSAPQPFESADYFELAGDDKAALGASLLRQEEFVLRPGEQRRVRRKAATGMRALGVTAAYRDLPQSAWRACRELQAPQSHWWNSVLPTPTFRARVDLRARNVAIQVA